MVCQVTVVWLMKKNITTYYWITKNAGKRASSEPMLGQTRNTPFYSRHPLLIFGMLLPNEIRVAPCKFVGESPFTIVLRKANLDNGPDFNALSYIW